MVHFTHPRSAHEWSFCRFSGGTVYRDVWLPKYAGFVVIMLGFLVQWPTLLTLLMFPMLVTMYVRLAHREECDALAEFGEAYAR